MGTNPVVEVGLLDLEVVLVDVMSRVFDLHDVVDVQWRRESLGPVRVGHDFWMIRAVIAGVV